MDKIKQKDNIVIVGVLGMEILGSVGQLYTLILLVLLFLGVGFLLWSFANFIIDLGAGKGKIGGKNNGKAPVLSQVNNSDKKSFKNLNGGLNMNNGWFKLAALSFVGIFISIIALGFLSTSNQAGADIHQQHQQQGLYQGQNNMYMTGTSGNMGMQMNGQMMPANDMMMMQQQLNYMQQQLYYMQQQMGMMNGNMGGMSGMGSMQQGGSGSMGGMGMMNGMMGGMGMMNMGGMGSTGSMQQNNGGMNMNQNSGSMGGMGMMGMM